MKIFFWLLIAVNVILFAVMKFGMLDGGGNASRLAPLNAEKIMLMTDEPAKSAPVAVSAQSATALVPVAASAPVAAPVTEGTCFEWGGFSGLALDRAKKSLEKLSLGGQLSQREVEPVIGFWVYIAPLNNKVAINQQLLQLKQHGVTDYFVVQDAGEWFNAISLGLFKNRDAAQSFLQDLHDKGINSAQVGERRGTNRTVVFMVNGADAQMTAKLMALQKDFAASELKRVQCH